MDDREALIAAIAKNPDDDTARLVYADWLDEHNDPDRAEFIRAQIGLAKLPVGDSKRQGLQTRVNELRIAHCQEWLKGIEDLNSPIDPESVPFERGFPVLMENIGRAFHDNRWELLKILIALSPAEVNTDGVFLDPAVDADAVYYPPFSRNTKTLLVALCGVWGMFSEDHEDMLRYLLALPQIDVNKKDTDGWTPLRMAVNNGHQFAVDALLKHPEININAASDVHKITALHLAVMRDAPKALDALLKHSRIDVNVQDGHGGTPLHRAITQYKVETCVALLGAHGIDVNAQNEDGLTPLMRTIYNPGMRPVFDALLKRRDIDLDLKDAKGRSAMDYIEDKVTTSARTADLAYMRQELKNAMAKRQPKEHPRINPTGRSAEEGRQ